AMKPVASGCERTRAGLRNADALALAAASNLAADYDCINPYAFEPAIAPHLAAREAGVVIDPARILAAFRALSERADAVVVEGVGGWQVPIGDDATMADVARLLDLPVVLVVGIRLGCINHALLTAQAVRAAGLSLAGWVACRVDPACERPEENVAAIGERLAAPLLGDIPWLASASPDAAAACLEDVLPLLS
ncbi:MAG TPA: dethiobiotin synthase, partial [Gammaproteobacteria bacterium]|nr:dethiobiotin synthase [Gammaproteobacteria bacterium]